MDTSIKDNITFLSDRISEQDLDNVIKISHLNEYLKRLPNGLDTIIGEKNNKILEVSPKNRFSKSINKKTSNINFG